MKKIIFLVLFLVSVMGSGYLLLNQMYTISIVAVTFTVLVLLLLINSLFEEKTPETKYNRILRDLIKTFEAILVDIDKLPDFDVKNIIKVSNFEKLVDIQYELKKPIFYKMSLNSCSFILMDSEIAYVYILRVNDDSFSPLDDIMLSIEDSAVKRRKDKKTLEGIDKTTIIKINDSKEYKVSPVRKIDLTEENNVSVSDESVLDDDYKVKETEIVEEEIAESINDDLTISEEIIEETSEIVLEPIQEELESVEDDVVLDDIINEEEVIENAVLDIVEKEIEEEKIDVVENDIESEVVVEEEQVINLEDDKEEVFEQTSEIDTNNEMIESTKNEKVKDKKQQQNKYKKNYANMRKARIYKNQQSKNKRK